MTALIPDMADSTRETASQAYALSDGGNQDKDCSTLAPIRDGSVRLRETSRIPRITIHAFCDSSAVAELIECASRDRFMSRTRVSVRMGGMAAAVELYQHSSSPNLVLVESRLDSPTLLVQLDQLALVCDPSTRVMIIGHTNDIALYRELIKRGVSEYLLAPVDPVALISAISRVYGEGSTGKIGKNFAFIGAKGGVGSSTIAHNVGWTLAHHLRSDVVLADMDLPFGTASLDFNLDTDQGVAEAIQDTSRLDEVLFDRLLTKYNDHLSLLAAPVTLARPFDLHENTMEPLLDVAQASVPFTVLDLPHSWPAWVRNVLIAAEEIVITAVPDLASLRNAKNMLEVLTRARPNDPPPKLVLNQVGLPKRPEIKVREFAKSLQLEPIACIPFDAQLFGAAANKGQVVAEASSGAVASKAFVDIAEAITSRQELRRREKGLLGFGPLVGKLKRRPAS